MSIYNFNNIYRKMNSDNNSNTIFIKSVDKVKSTDNHLNYEDIKSNISTEQSIHISKTNKFGAFWKI